MAVWVKSFASLEVGGGGGGGRWGFSMHSVSQWCKLTTHIHVHFAKAHITCNYKKFRTEHYDFIGLVGKYFLPFQVNFQVQKL